MSSEELINYKKQIAASGTSFLSVNVEENNDEYHHFYFIGKFENKEVLFDAIVYTLRLQHETEIYALAEEATIAEFPAYSHYILAEDGATTPTPDIEDQIGMFMADAIVQFEEDGDVKVSEHIDLDTESDFGIGFEAGLRVDVINNQIIEKLINDFNTDSLVLDETLLTFHSEGSD